jgi:hypothetical protein
MDAAAASAHAVEGRGLHAGLAADAVQGRGLCTGLPIQLGPF